MLFQLLIGRGQTGRQTVGHFSGAAPKRRSLESMVEAWNITII